MLNPERPAPEHRSNSNGFRRKQLPPVRIVIRDQYSAGEGFGSPMVEARISSAVRGAPTEDGWVGSDMAARSLVYERRFKTGTELARMPVRS